MAELVDALVSNTSGSNAVPVRSRLRVLKKSESESESELARTITLDLFPLNTLTHSHSLKIIYFSQIFLKLALSLIYFYFLGLTNITVMWDFQKLEAYQKFKNFCKEITVTLSEKRFDRTTNDQLRRVSFSIMLNIAEGTSRFSIKDRRNFL